MIPLLGDGYELVGLGLLTVLALVPATLTFMVFMDAAKSLILHTPRRRKLLYLALIADLLVAISAVDAWMIEPKMMTVTRISQESPKIARETGELKIVHVSDIHFEKDKVVTVRLLRDVREQEPDLIILTGDIHQMGNYDRPQFRRFLTDLCSIAPAYGVTGYYEDGVLREAPAAGLQILDDTSATLTIRGTRVFLRGLDSKFTLGDRPLEGEHALSIILDHSPDGIPHAKTMHADWYFCGHTHGGQVRLPFWGAIVTLSETGKQYEYGYYEVGGMHAFVTRGIGLEPRPAPQVRFLCPPEIVVLTLTPSN